MKVTISDRAPALQNGPRTLAIDVGCTGLKASVLDQVDKIPADRIRVATPHPCWPKVLNRRERRSRGARVIEFGRSRQTAALHGDYDARHVVARTS
jgi:hypothetical protein